VLQRVLVIDDDEAIHALIKVRLAGESVQLHSAYDGESGLELAASALPDLILLDVDMPQPDGFEVCRRLKHDPLTMNIQVIFLSGASSTEEKIRGLNLGAVDYVTKPFDPAELRARVRVSLRTKYLLDLLAKRAMIDGLTGLWNRAYFDQRLLAELGLSSRCGRPLACTLLDVDHFKRVNDTYGHSRGDEVLRGVGQVLLEESRAEDIVCRYGGEEFVILTPDATAQGAAAHAERVRTLLASRAFGREQDAARVTASFGCADTVMWGLAALVEAADKALYEAKGAGRNRVVVARAAPPLARASA